MIANVNHQQMNINKPRFLFAPSDLVVDDQLISIFSRRNPRYSSNLSIL